MKKIFLLITCIAFFVACKKEKVTGPEGPQGPAGNSNTNTGTISGKIDQYDQYGIKCITGLNTTTVSIIGTNYMAVTDTTGHYSLNNVQAGTYALLFNKPGYGAIQKQQITFAGNGTFYFNADILEKPTYSFISGSIKDTVQFSIPKRWITINLASLSKQSGVMVISGPNSNPDILNPLTYNNVLTFSIPANSTNYTYTNAFPVSGTIYYKVYPYPPAPWYGSYYDYPSDQTFYMSYGIALPTYSITAP